MFNRQISNKLSINKLITIFLQRENSVARNTYAITIIYILLTAKPGKNWGALMGKAPLIFPLYYFFKSDFHVIWLFKIFLNT